MRKSSARRVLTFVLSFLMVFSSFPVQALAEVIGDEPQIEVALEEPPEGMSEDEGDDCEQSPVVELEGEGVADEDNSGYVAASPVVGDEEVITDDADNEGVCEEGVNRFDETPADPMAAEEDTGSIQSTRESTVVASGTWGTCPWELTDDGILTVHPGVGATQTATYSPWLTWADRITSVTFLGEGGERVVAPESSSYLFGRLANLATVDASGLDTSSVTNMNGMFSGCSSLASLDLSPLDTSSVTDMGWMFSGCSSLASLDLSGWDTSSVTDMSIMFSGCSSLASLDASGWDISHVTNMLHLFDGCSSLASLDLSGWEFSSVTNMNGMFRSCSSLASLDVSGWDTSSVTDMDYMFSGCSSLTALDLSGWDTSSVTDVSYMFQGCSGLTTIRVGENWTTMKVSFSDGMFTGCVALVGGNGTAYDPSHTNVSYAHPDFPSNPGYFTGGELDWVAASGTWGTCPWELKYDGTLTVHPGVGETQAASGGGFWASSPWAKWADGITSVTFLEEGGERVVAPDCSAYLFGRLANLATVDASGLDTSSVTNMNGMFSGCSSLASLDLSGFDTSSVTDMRSMFDSCSRLSSLDLSGWGTSRVTNMSYMFNGCSRLSSLDLSGWGTSSVTNMEHMFHNCSSLTSLDLSGWDTSAVWNMSYMFSGCSRLSSLDLSGWGTSSVTNMEHMFHNCSSLTSLDLSGWGNARVTNMSYMFDGCSRLSSLDLSGWGTSRVTNMGLMFQSCSSLTSLDLSGWDTASVTDMYSMFNGCSRLTTIRVGAGWSTAVVTSSSSMFTGCVSLVGGSGTVYDSSHTNVSYAHADAPGSPGYLTGGPDAVAASGNWGTCPWEITVGGALTVHPGVGASQDGSTASPWAEHSAGITSVSFLGEGGEMVVAPQSSRLLLRGLSNVVTVDLSGLNTTDVTNMRGMFSGCSSLTSLDLSGLDTSSVTDMSYMFQDCSELATIRVDASWSTAAVRSSASMFYGCGSLVGGNGTRYNSSNVTATYARIDGPGTPGYLTGPDPIDIATATVSPIPDQYFTGSPVTPSVTVTFDGVQLSEGTDYVLSYSDNTGIGTATVTVTGRGWYTGTCNATFEVIRSLVVVASGTWGTCPWELTDDGILAVHPGVGASQEDAEGSPWAEYKGDVRMVVFLEEGGRKVVAPTNSKMLFDGFANLTSVDLSGLDISRVTEMFGMFRMCSSLAELDVSDWDISGVEGTGMMFTGCSSLTSLDVSRWNTSDVTDMFFMFAGCSNLTSLDVSNWNTSSVESTWSTFSGCSSLTSLDVSRWDTSSVAEMWNMFTGCSSLTSLDLSSWDTSNVRTMEGMFQDCSGLSTIRVGDGWTTWKVSDSEGMFDGCASLVGGNGTVYDPAHTDVLYARVDVPGLPGYLTGESSSTPFVPPYDREYFTFLDEEETEAVAIEGQSAALEGEGPGARVFQLELASESRVLFVFGAAEYPSEGEDTPDVKVRVVDERGSVVAFADWMQSLSSVQKHWTDGGSYVTDGYLLSDTLPEGTYYIIVENHELDATTLFSAMYVRFDGAGPFYDVRVTGGHTTPVPAAVGEKVTLVPGAPPEGKVFDSWNVVSGNVTISSSGTFTMPRRDVEIEAVWRDKGTWRPNVDESEIIHVGRGETKLTAVAYGLNSSSLLPKEAWFSFDVTSTNDVTLFLAVDTDGKPFPMQSFDIFDSDGNEIASLNMMSDATYADWDNYLYGIRTRLHLLDPGTYYIHVLNSYPEKNYCCWAYVEYTGMGFPMYRLYNQWTGEHLYTGDEAERDRAVTAGWTYEGIGWWAPATGDPVYRLYNPWVTGGDHHYTTSWSEYQSCIAAGWKGEGICWLSDPNHTVPVYREYNPWKFSCNHNYTADRSEHNHLLEVGWRDEGIGWYGV